MLFNSYTFLLVFLPVVLLGYHLLARDRFARAPLWWLLAASLFFYGCWEPRHLPLLLLSGAGNFAIGRALARPGRTARERRRLLLLGLAANLGAIVWFKYLHFLLGTAGALVGIELRPAEIALPLAISFFTFQQIAYLVDVHRDPGKGERRFGKYLLFVTFFPQLVAGPIVHHGELMPQLDMPRRRGLRGHEVVLGGSIFVAGLFKKVVIADTLAPFANAVFDGAAAGAAPDLLAAWAGAVAYALQIYFDFSGYSDMALGLGRCFGVRLPANFDSPYQATNIVDFWRRWHMTLSAFLRDYLYFALGGNRRGRARRYANLMITMLLGGLWHGAGWSFVLWGGLHGTFLVVNHGFRALRARLGWTGSRGAAGRAASTALTLLCVLLAWVFFRAEDLDAARSVLAGMAGRNGIALPASQLAALGAAGGWLVERGVVAGEAGIAGTRLWEVTLLLLLAGGVCLLAPNTQEIFATPSAGEPAPGRRARRLRWRPTPAWAACTGVAAALALSAASGAVEFLYFRF